MAYSITWGLEDRIKYGKCNRYLEEVVYFSFEKPSIAGGDPISSPERDSHYCLNDPEVLKHYARGLSIPEGDGYAFEFTEMSVFRTMEEIEQILREIAERMIPSGQTRNKGIEAYVQKRLPQHPEDFAIGSELGFKTVKKFIRWVENEEYEEKIKDAMAGDESEEIGITTRWDILGLTSDGRREMGKACSICPLSVDLQPSIEKNEFYNYCYHSIGGYSTFFDYISNYHNFSILVDDIIRDGIEVSRIDGLLAELRCSREILNSKNVSLMVLFDRNGTEIATQGESHYLEPNISEGYRINVVDERSAITLEYAGDLIFEIPEEALIDVDMKDTRSYVFEFKEIYYNNGSYIGVFRTGNEIEFPVCNIENHIETPFHGLDNEAGVCGVKHKLAPAMEEYGDLQMILESYVLIAKKFQIPIVFL